MRGAIAIVGLIALATACRLGPDYRRPTIDSPSQFGDAPTQESLADVAWWEIFEDPVLQQLIETALAENKDLLATAWRIEAARAQLGVVKADLYPSFFFEGSAVRTDPSDETPGGPANESDDFVAAGGVSWELDLWGKLRRSNEAARSELFAAEWNRRALIVSLVAEVARTYFLIRDLDTRLEVSTRTLESRKDSTDLIRKRFNGGIVSELDVHQAEIEEATAAAAVPAFERQVVQAELALSVLLGRNPGPIPRGHDLLEQSLPLDPPAGLPSELLQRRPDVRETEELLHAQMARIGVAQALRWPSLTLSGSGGLQSDDTSDFSDGDFWSVGANLLGPIFQFGKNRRRVERERAFTEAAILDYEATVLDAFREVEQALVATRTLREEYRARVVQVKAARQARELSRARYDGGVTSYLEVLDIERSLFQSELETSRTLQEQLTSIVDLYAALGGGWDPDEPFVLPESKIDADEGAAE